MAVAQNEHEKAECSNRTFMELKFEHFDELMEDDEF